MKTTDGKLVPLGSSVFSNKKPNVQNICQFLTTGGSTDSEQYGSAGHQALNHCRLFFKRKLAPLSTS